MTQNHSSSLSQPSSLPPGNAAALAWDLPTWAILMAVLVLATIVRLVFFNGIFGSDDLVYLNRAVQISEGIWSSANYNGALRYGFNIPAGFFIYLFGVNLFAANLWPLLCSLAEIAIIYWFALGLWGWRAALYSGLILVCMPLHIAVSTRLHADPVVSLFLTLSFVLFFVAGQRRSPLLYFLTGLTMGLVFWTKELLLIALFAFALYPLLARRLDLRWLYIVGGGLVMLFAHFLLMFVIAGDPLHLFKVMTIQLDRDFIHGGKEDQVWYYFWYLFIDIKHTWLAPFLAAITVIIVTRRRFSSSSVDTGIAYVVFWLVSLLAVLSFTPISWEPLRFVTKQSNYLTLFLAPIALLAGYLVARLSRWIGFIVLAVVMAGGFALGALEQQAYHVFTSNSKAAVEFAKAHPDSWIVGSINNGNIARVYSILNRDPALEDRFGYLSKGALPKEVEASAVGRMTGGYAVLDWETMEWGSDAMKLDTPPRCWQEITRLAPTGFGFSQTLIKGMLAIIEVLPESIGRRLAPPLQRLSQPRPAIVYRVDGTDLWCERGKDSVAN